MEYIIKVVEDPDYAGETPTTYTAQCPHCGVLGTEFVREVDEATRWNRGVLEIKGGEIVAADWNPGQADFQHKEYACNNCSQPVILPDDIQESWS
jgi:hypothetical protein